MEFNASRSSCLLLVVGSILIVDGQVQECPEDPTIQGYTTITAMNADMQAELEAINNGQAPQPGYTYTLCPDTAFDTTSTPLLPVLNNITFVCGATGSSASNCVLFGGDEQIRIEDSTVESYPLQQVSFSGLSMANFTGTAVNAAAGTTTTASFNDVDFQVSP